jgi:carboxylesterase type B
VNVFGFPASAGALGNPGLTDIRLVVEWVRDNIESFGYGPHKLLNKDRNNAD